MWPQSGLIDVAWEKRSDKGTIWTFTHSSFLYIPWLWVCIKSKPESVISEKCQLRPLVRSARRIKETCIERKKQISGSEKKVVLEFQLLFCLFYFVPKSNQIVKLLYFPTVWSHWVWHLPSADFKSARCCWHFYWFMIACKLWWCLVYSIFIHFFPISSQRKKLITSKTSTLCSENVDNTFCLELPFFPSLLSLFM